MKQEKITKAHLKNDTENYDVNSEKVAELLSSKGFSRKMAGFSYLCCAIEKTAADPELLKASIMDIYRISGETTGISINHAERILRNFSNSVFENKIRINGELNETKLKNHELISALTKEYIMNKTM